VVEGTNAFQGREEILLGLAGMGSSQGRGNDGRWTNAEKITKERQLTLSVTELKAGGKSGRGNAGGDYTFHFCTGKSTHYCSENLWVQRKRGVAEKTPTGLNYGEMLQLKPSICKSPGENFDQKGVST